MGLTCKNCNVNLVDKTKLDIEYNIYEVDEGIIVKLSYNEKIKYPIKLNEFTTHLSYIRNEFMFQNPFFSSKKGVINYNSAEITFDKDIMYINHYILIDKNVYTINQLKEMFK